MTPTDTRILQIAHAFEAYPDSNEITLRGDDSIVQFARALLAEAVGAQAYTRPGTTSSAAAPKDAVNACLTEVEGKRVEEWDDPKPFFSTTGLVRTQRSVRAKR